MANNHSAEWLRQDMNRFMSCVIPEPNSGCWLWVGRYGGKGGYGQFQPNGASSPIRAHRWIYEQVNSAIAEGLIVRHKCDIKPCVNPAHLLVGTVKDNAFDCVRSGNHPSARKTHCPSGHPYEAWNLAFRSDPRIRICATCDRIHKQNNEAKNGKR